MDPLERLYRDHHAPIVRYLTRQLRDADLAEELAQETFVRAMRHRPEVNARAWLFTVATNLVRDTVRRETRQRRLLERLQHEETIAAEVREAPSPDDTHRTALARAALDELPERDRSALHMRQEGLSYPEIAAALGLSVQSVGTTLTRARKRLVEQYERLAEAPGAGDNRARS
jgi:RNA polymerase sigma-70 factor (ECF subfamily)